MRLTLSLVFAVPALTFADVSTSNAADPVVTLTELPVSMAQGGGKVVTPKGTFTMNGHSLNKIEIEAWNGAAWVLQQGPTGMINANNWTLNPSLSGRSHVQVSR